MCKSKNKKTIKIFTLLLVIIACLSLNKGTSTVLASETTSVSKEMLSVKCQTKRNANGTADLRIVSTVDENLELYKTVGFDIQFMAGVDATSEPERNIPYQKGYVSYHIDATVDGVPFDFNPKVFHTSSEYFITVTVTGIPESYHDNYILIKPFVTLTDNKDDKTYGESRYITINDGFVGNVLSIPFEGNITTVVEEGAATTVGALDGTFEEPYYDATTDYTHVRINLGQNKTNALNSVTELTIGGATVKYRNLHSTATTADTSWYTLMNTDANDEFVIVTRADLLGFSALVDGDTDAGTITFANEKIYMGGDITVNNYTKEEMQASATGTGSTISGLISWDPIGTAVNQNTGAPFAGKFDGMNQTISGLYQKHGTDRNGLFYATTSDSEVKKLRLENSYFYKTTVSSSARPSGGIAAYGAGLFDTIYCDVILHNNAANTGGIVGDTSASYGNLELNNCWFAGKMISEDTKNDSALQMGGLLGRVNGGITATITNCLFTGNIDCGSGAKTAKLYVGGIFGQNNASKTKLTSVLSIGSITSNGGSQVGRILGGVSGTTTNNISASYALDSVCAGAESNGATLFKSNKEIHFTSDNLVGNTAKDEGGPSGLFGTDSCWTTQVISHPIPSSFQWYDETRRVLDIDNAVELYEFAKVSQTNDFKNKVVRLTSDITVNEGTSEEVKGNATSALQWTPIGTKNISFAGTFDGQGYTISGIYCVDESSAKGLFLATAPSSVVKDFAFINSYIATTKEQTSVKATAGIAAYGEGVFDSIYCDVILENNAVVTGGIVADMQGLGENLEIKNCWFAGSIKSANTLKYDIDMGGIIGWARNCETVTITDCLFTGILDYGTGKTTNSVYVAGIVGRAGLPENIVRIDLSRVVSVGVINGSGGKAINAICDTTPNRSSTTYEAVYENVTSETGVTISKPNDVADLSSTRAEGLFSGDGANNWICLDESPILKKFCNEFYVGRTIARNDYLETMNPIEYTPRTVEAWVKVDTDMPTNVRPGVLAGNYTSTGEQGFNVEIKAGGKPAIYWNGKEGTEVNQTYDVHVRTGEWTHLAITVSADKAICYINGNPIGEIDGTFDDISKELLKKFRVGVDYRSSIPAAFNSEYMEIASIALYDDVRSADEIASDMIGMDKNDKSLLGLYYIASDESDALKDLSSYNNHLTSTSGVEESKVFTADKLYSMSNPLNVTPKRFDATVYFPETMSADTRGGVIFGNYVDANHACICFEIHKNGNPRIYLLAPNAESGVMEAYNYIFKDINVYNGQLTNISVTIEADALKCYVDGELKQTLTPDGNTIPVPPETLLCSNAMSLGGDARKNNEQYFKGRIASATLYDDSDNVIVQYDTTYLSVATTVIQDLSSNNYDAMLNDWINPEEYDGVTDYAYSIAVLGDTQRINRFYPDKFDGIYDWIINNAASKNIQMVLGMGDITDNSTEEEWNRAQSNFQRLDEANIPYAVVRGNHDKTEHFNQYFSYASYKNQLDGCMVEGDLTNAWRKVEINGVKYLIMMLDYGPTDAVLKWAAEVIEANKDHNVIITTHAYLFRDGTTLDENDVVPPSQSNKDSNNGDHMWDELIKKHENIVLVLSGHDPYDNVVTTQTVGDNGNVVTQMLIDPQNMDVNAGPAGMVAMLYFSEDGKTVQLEYYSTARNQYWKACNQYTITLDVVE